MALVKLLLFRGMAPPAVVRRDDHTDFLAIVVEGRRVAIVGLVAGVAIHVLLGVRALAPLRHNPRGSAAVAVEAHLRLGRNLRSRCFRWRRLGWRRQDVSSQG